MNPMDAADTLHTAITDLHIGGRPFDLHRHKDPSGVSGLGVVASGWQCAHCTILGWRGRFPSVAVFPGGIPHIEAVHGHSGLSVIRFTDGGGE